MHWVAAPCTSYCDWQLQNGGSRTFDQPAGTGLGPLAEAERLGNHLSEYAAEIFEASIDNGGFPVAESSAASGLGPPDEPNAFYVHRARLVFPRHGPLRRLLQRQCPGLSSTHKHVALKGCREGQKVTRCTEAGVVYAPNFLSWGLVSPQQRQGATGGLFFVSSDELVPEWRLGGYSHPPYRRVGKGKAKGEKGKRAPMPTRVPEEVRGVWLDLPESTSTSATFGHAAGPGDEWAGRANHWNYDPRRRQLWRIHDVPRTHLYVPQELGLPTPLAHLIDERRTYIKTRARTSSSRTIGGPRVLLTWAMGTGRGPRSSPRGSSRSRTTPTCPPTTRTGTTRRTTTTKMIPNRYRTRRSPGGEDRRGWNAVSKYIALLFKRRE